MKAIMHQVLNFSKESMMSWTPHFTATLHSNDYKGDSLTQNKSLLQSLSLELVESIRKRSPYIFKRERQHHMGYFLSAGNEAYIL